MEKKEYFVFIDNYHEGIVDSDNNIVIPAVYEVINNFSKSGLAAVKLDDKWGFVDKENNMIIPNIYYNANSFSDNGLAAVKFTENYSSWGLINTNGEVVCAPKYTSIGKFNRMGIAPARMNHFMGFINQKGEFIDVPVYSTIREIDNSNYYYAKKFEKLGYINKDGKNITPFIYDEAYSFNDDGIALAVLNGKHGCINTNGETVVEFKYDMMAEFSEGMSFFTDEKGLYGYMDINENVIIEHKYKDAGFFMHGYAPVTEDNETYYFIDKNGENTFGKTFRMANSFSKYGLARVVFNDGSKGFINIDGETVFLTDLEVEDFNKNVSVYLENGKCGIMNSKGEKLTEAIYDEIRMSKGKEYNAFRKNRVWGFIDNFGVVVFKPIFFNAGPFTKKGYARVEFLDEEAETKHFGYLDTDGYIEAEPSIEDLYDLSDDGIGVVRVGGLYYFVNEKMEFINPSVYEWSSKFHNGYASATRPGYYILINENGEEIQVNNNDYNVVFDEDGSFCLEYNTKRINTKYVKQSKLKNDNSIELDRLLLDIFTKEEVLDVYLNVLTDELIQIEFNPYKHNGMDINVYKGKIEHGKLTIPESMRRALKLKYNQKILIGTINKSFILQYKVGNIPTKVALEKIKRDNKRIMQATASREEVYYPDSLMLN